MNSTPTPNAAEPGEGPAASADERLAEAQREIARADEELTRLSERLAKMERDAAPPPRAPSPPSAACWPAAGSPRARKFKPSKPNSRSCLAAGPSGLSAMALPPKLLQPQRRHTQLYSKRIPGPGHRQKRAV